MQVRPKTEEKTDHGPLRRCAVTRNRRPPELLLRFVVDPQGKLTEDLTGRLPGRGFYVIPDPKRVTALLLRHKMTKAEIDAVLMRLEQALIRRLLDGIGLSRRAGGCKVGLREVEELLKRGQHPLVLLATDAGSIREKVACLMQSHDELEVVDILDREQLGTVWGDKLIALAAITHAGVAQRVRIDAARWRSFMQVVKKEELIEARERRPDQKRVPHNKKGMSETGVCRPNNVPEGH